MLYYAVNDVAFMYESLGFDDGANLKISMRDF
jgi:hypothetical protein